VTTKDDLLSNQFALLLRTDAIADPNEFAALRKGLIRLSAEWQGRDVVDKELAGWLLTTVAMVGGARERLERNGARDLEHDVAGKLAELYELVERCFMA